MSKPGMWDIWNLSRSDLSGVVVGEGTRAEARESAADRNATAEKMNMADVVFIALPRGQQPSWEDLPLAAPAAREAPRPRRIDDVQADLAALAMSPVRNGSKAAKASRLALEAFELGRRAERSAARESIAIAWSAFLEMVPKDFWATLPYDDPELYRRFRRIVLGEAV